MAELEVLQRAYTLIQRHFIETGRAPHFTELAGHFNVSPDQARALVRETAAAGVGCWMTPDTDYVGSWAPFSNVPTQYLITIDGVQKWYGQ